MQLIDLNQICFSLFCSPLDNETQCIPGVQEFIVRYLKDTRGQQAMSDRATNEMTLQVLLLARCLMRFGMFASAIEIRKLIQVCSPHDLPRRFYMSGCLSLLMPSARV